tara:strand:- start:2652 stop:2948 length:297 start_codon:yes stop_codon:yes gene_type:complete
MIDVDRQVRSVRSSKDKHFCFEKKSHLQKKYNERIKTLILCKHRDNKQKIRDFREDEFMPTNMSSLVKIHENEWVVISTEDISVSVPWYQCIFNLLRK